MILIDTSIWIPVLHGFRGEDDLVQDAVATGNVVLGDLILMEILRGARTEAAEKFRTQLAAFPVLPLGGRHLAEQAAANYRKLRALGITIRGSIDVLIATFCIEGGHDLLHRDRDFDHFEQHLGLRVLRSA